MSWVDRLRELNEIDLNDLDLRKCRILAGRRARYCCGNAFCLNRRTGLLLPHSQFI